MFSYWCCLRVLCVFWTPVLYLVCFLQEFFPTCGLPLHSLDGVILQRRFHFSEAWPVSSLLDGERFWHFGRGVGAKLKVV